MAEAFVWAQGNPPIAHIGTGPAIASHLRALTSLTAVSLLVSAGAAAPLSAATSVSDPVAFFTGQTEGRGTLDQVAASPRDTHTASVGSRAGGAFVIEQTVKVEGDPDKQRRWQLRETTPGHYSGTISDAAGPVTAVVSGGRLQIRYTMKERGLRVDQTVTVASDGRSATNAMKFRKFGIVVATLDETIRKL